MNPAGRKPHHSRPLPKRHQRLSMNRWLIAVGFSMIATGLVANQITSSATFRTKDLVVTGISPSGFIYSPGKPDANGLAPFQVVGDPMLTATLSREHLTVTGGKLEGKVVPGSGRLASAVLSGNIQVVSVISPKGHHGAEAQRIELESSTAHYKNLNWSKGSSSPQSTQLSFPNPLLVKGSSQTKLTSYQMHAKTGTVYLKEEAAGQSQSLDSARFVGAVTMSFNSQVTGVKIQGDLRHLTASSDRATIDRVVDPKTQAITYVVKLLGHVNLKSEEPSGTTTLSDLSGLAVTLNPQFEVLGYEGLDDQASGFFVPQSLSGSNSRLAVLVENYGRAGQEGSP